MGNPEDGNEELTLADLVDLVEHAIVTGTYPPLAPTTDKASGGGKGEDSRPVARSRPGFGT